MPYQSLLKTYLADRVRQEFTGFAYPAGPLASFEVHELPAGRASRPGKARPPKASK